MFGILFRSFLFANFLENWPHLRGSIAGKNNSRQRSLGRPELYCNHWDFHKLACIDKNTSCIAPRQNTIIFHDPDTTSGAGILSRMYIWDITAVIAQALCARTLWPTPHMLLSVGHNGGKEILCSKRWSDYYDWDEEVMGSWYKPHFNVDWPFIDTENCSGHCSDENGRCLDKQADFSALITAAQRGRRLVYSVAAAFDSYHKGIPFVLVIAPFTSKNFTGVYPTRSWDPSVPSGGLAKSCHGAFKRLQGLPSCREQRGYPIATQCAARGIVYGLSKYLVVHIRRTDLKHVCDTSPSEVELVLNCAIGHYNGTYPGVILFTDEPSAVYVSQVLAVMRKFARRAISGDDAAKHTTMLMGQSTKSDNYNLFNVYNALVSSVVHPSLFPFGSRQNPRQHRNTMGCKRLCESNSRVKGYRYSHAGYFSGMQTIKCGCGCADERYSSVNKCTRSQCSACMECMTYQENNQNTLKKLHIARETSSKSTTTSDQPWTTTQTEQECANLCTKDALCQAFVRDQRTNICYLYRNADQQVRYCGRKGRTLTMKSTYSAYFKCRFTPADANPEVVSIEFGGHHGSHEQTCSGLKKCDRNTKL